MINCLISDVLHLVAGMLSQAEIGSLAFVCRDLRDFAGEYTREEVLSLCIQEEHFDLYREYLKRLRLFPLCLSADLGRTGNKQMIELTEYSVPYDSRTYFRFNVSRGLIIGNHHKLFHDSRIYLSARNRELAIASYFDDWRNIQPSPDVIEHYLLALPREEITEKRLANIFRAAPDLAEDILYFARQFDLDTILFAALEADCSQAFVSRFFQARDVGRFYPYASRQLVLELADIDDCLTSFYFGYAIYHHDLELLFAKIDSFYVYANRDSIRYMFRTLTPRELAEVLSHPVRCKKGIFEYIEPKIEHYRLLLSHRYSLEFYTYCFNSGVAILTFQPPITDPDDSRLQFIELLGNHSEVTKFLVKHQKHISVDYQCLLNDDTKEFLINEKKLTAEFCSSKSDLWQLWINRWGFDNLSVIACRHIYWRFSHAKNRCGQKRKREDIDKLLSLVEKNKDAFIQGIVGARDTDFKYEVLEAIVENVDLNSRQKGLVERALLQGNVLAPSPKKQRT